jgi:hypothetical protein
MFAYQGLPIPYGFKIAFCICCDLFDMTIGRLLLGVSIFTDVVSALIMFLFWGPIGLFAIWEAADVTEQLDGFVPTNTLIALAAHKRHAG